MLREIRAFMTVHQTGFTKVGEELKELIIPIDNLHIFMFSAITWNRHAIHYNQDAAKAEGHSNVLAQRGLLGNYLARMILETYPDRVKVSSLEWKVICSAVPGDEIYCNGRVIEVLKENDLYLITANVEIKNQRKVVVVSGRAKFSVHS